MRQDDIVRFVERSSLWRTNPETWADQANPWWRDPNARPAIPVLLPGDVRVTRAPATITSIHAAPRGGATTRLLRTISEALDASQSAAFIPAEASATWGTEALLEGLSVDPPAVVAIDEPKGTEWPEYLKMLIDSAPPQPSSLSASAIVVAVPGLTDATRIAGTLAGRQGSGGRQVLLPRRYRDVLEHQDMDVFGRAQAAAWQAGDDVVAFARQLQVMRRRLETAWDRYVASGGLPPAFDDPVSTDAKSTWAAARSITAPTAGVATDSAIILGEVNRNAAASLTDLADAAARSHSWVRRLDQRAQEALVWFKVRQPGRPQGSARRVLVDPAYAEVVEPESKRHPKHTEALLRSIWHNSHEGGPDLAHHHDLQWWRQGSHELYAAGQWVFEMTAGVDPDQRRLRPLRSLASRGFRPLRVSHGDAEFSVIPPLVPIWAFALAFDFGVASVR